MKTTAIVQARTGSTRLPGKILTDIAGRPMLWHVVQRAMLARTLDQVVVATTDKAADNAVATFCSQAGIPCSRGSEDDVLDRYYQTARSIGADPVVRITADCPLMDPEVIDRVVGKFTAGKYDYVSNILPRTYPQGLDTEIFSFAALERMWRGAVDPYDREHVTPYLHAHPELFCIGNVENPVDHSAQRWTVDYPQDMQFVQAVYAKMPQGTFGLMQVLQLLERHPELVRTNSETHPRNPSRSGR